MENLHVDSIIKHYGKFQILSDIFISCDKGEIIGLLGRNGSGKSTLLKIIFGSLHSDNKFVRVDNKLAKNPFINRKLINYMPQDSFIPKHIRINNVISLFCPKAASEIVKKDDFIKPLLYKKAGQISGGERKLLEIYLTVFSESKYALIDEPFNGMAPVIKDKVKDLITQQSKHKGIIITDHDYRNVIDIATKVILLYQGSTKQIQHLDDLKHWGYIN